MWHDRSLEQRDALGKRYAQEAAALIQRHADVPFAFVALSLGVRFATATAVELANRPGAQAPRVIFALGGSVKPPQLPTLEMQQYMMRKLFLRDVQGYARPEQQVVSDVRADEQIARAIGFEDPEEQTSKIAIPVVAATAHEDTFVPPADVRALESYTTGHFCIHFFPGNHDFLVDYHTDLMQLVDGHLERLLATTAAAALPAPELCLAPRTGDQGGDDVGVR
jgi:surfactin synthase thioesterase subunit